MRIAYVCVDPGIPVFGTKGASVHVQEIVRAFRARGDEVTLYCTRRGDHVPGDLADVPVVEIAVGKGEPAERERSVAEASRQLAARIVTDGCDLVYERFSLFSRVGAVVAGATGAAFVLEVNAPLIEEQKQHRDLIDETGAVAAAHDALATADVVACVSEPVAAWAAAHGACSPLVVPNGVNTARIRPRDRGSDGPLRIGFVGTLKPWHGVEVLIDAVASLDERATLTLVGDGPEGPALLARAAERGVAVHPTGALRPADVPAALAALDVGVAPYPPGAGYFSPLKVYEYLAAGLAVVASAIGQVPAIIDHGRTGLLVEPGSADALAAALARLADDRGLTGRLSAEGRADAVAHHDWTRVLDRILTALPDRTPHEEVPA
ncbi:glycosyltransferase family 4 protein [Microbacterium oleivorans]|uniref:glycosyltransferase family 4 protein n=1 Tax=Microbacterium oleivorans TaxID=273677 RepID=UPI00203D09B9|nr:glycosyltransferase family 4 protein [Microbacterium oleivorans]MCM3697621.1 glycosyltransferase family 4 protein [Microbacterium oleivorans]